MGNTWTYDPRDHVMGVVPFYKSGIPIPERKICKICYATECNKLFSPCGHMACVKCASRAFSGGAKICPWCNQKIQGLVQLDLNDTA